MDPAPLDPGAPATVVLCALCRALLAEATAACARLDDPADGEALHDLRVALRRLRSQLRAGSGLLPRATGKKLRARMEELAEKTGEARDLEVQLAWLRGQREAVGAEHAGALDALVAWLDRRYHRAIERVRDEAAGHLRPLARRLTERLADDQAGADTSRSFARVVAPRTGEMATRLLHLVDALDSPHDEAKAHRARIAAKRLRYLVEPLRDAPPAIAEAATALVGRLKSLQDLLGELHDAHVLGHVIERALIAAARKQAPHQHRALTRPAQSTGAAQPTDPRAGLLAIDALVCAHRDQLFARLLAKRARRAFDPIATSAATLAARLTASS